MLDSDKRVFKEERERIIRGALRLAEDVGMGNLNAKTIGDSMGVGQEQILHIFPNINALWCAVLTWIEGRLMAVLEHSAEYEHDAVTALESMFRCHISFISYHMGVVRIVFSSLHADDTHLKCQIENILRRYEAGLDAMICLGKAEGSIRSEIDAQAVAIHFITLIQGLAMRMSILSHRDREAVIDEAQQVIKLYLEGIRHRPGSDAR